LPIDILAMLDGFPKAIFVVHTIAACWKQQASSGMYALCVRDGTIDLSAAQHGVSWRFLNDLACGNYK
jgi:hypothetical protein